ncbi:MAG: hydrogenase maturation protease [Anaerolineae bacterium]
MKVTVIGIGQTMRGDDAAGIEAVRRWERLYPNTAADPQVTVQYSELPGLSLLDLLDGFDGAVLVDAVESAAAAGQVYHLGPDQIDSFGHGGKTAHGWGVAETLQLDRQVNPERAGLRVRLVGIEAAQVEMGSPLSASVEAALPAACQAVEAEVQAMLAGSPLP